MFQMIIILVKSLNPSKKITGGGGGYKVQQGGVYKVQLFRYALKKIWASNYTQFFAYLRTKIRKP